MLRRSPSPAAASRQRAAGVCAPARQWPGGPGSDQVRSPWDAVSTQRRRRAEGEGQGAPPAPRTLGHRPVNPGATPPLLNLSQLHTGAQTASPVCFKLISGVCRGRGGGRGPMTRQFPDLFTEKEKSSTHPFPERPAAVATAAPLPMTCFSPLCLLGKVLS